MVSQPASATAGDRAQVHTLDAASDSDGQEQQESGEKRRYQTGPKGEHDPGWSDSVRVGGSELL